MKLKKPPRNTLGRSSQESIQIAIIIYYNIGEIAFEKRSAV
jgi:hypothetical protein